jgi:hypothetical protein
VRGWSGKHSASKNGLVTAASVPWEHQTQPLPEDDGEEDEGRDHDEVKKNKEIKHFSPK